MFIKKNNLLKCIFLFFINLSLFATVKFADLDLNNSNQLLFTCEHKIPGLPDYKTLFITELNEDGNIPSPKILTCFPESMTLLQNGTILQLRNRYGTAQYNLSNSSLNWISVANKIPTEYTHKSFYLENSNGTYECYVKQTKNAVGSLELVNTKTLQTIVLSENNPYCYGKINAKWSPSGKTLIYEKNQELYFITPEAAFKNIQLKEEYRHIGKGNVNSVYWTESNELIYIDGDVIYRIREKELYTRGLYSTFVGKGELIGRLAQNFNNLHDHFWCDNDVSQFIVITAEHIVTCYEIKKAGYDFAQIKSISSLSKINGTTLDFHLFWNEKKEPVLWIDYLSFNSNTKQSIVLKVNDSLKTVLEVSNTLDAKLSPDKKNVAFASDKNLYVYDINTWKRVSRFSGEKIHSYLWANPYSIYIGDEEAVRVWNVADGKEKSNSNAQDSNGKILFLSQAQNSHFDSKRIVCRLKNGKSFSFKSQTNTWSEANTINAKYELNEKNASYRVFLDSTTNSNFENGIYVRSLSGSVLTYPVCKETQDKIKNKKRVSIIFDALEAKDGLSTVLNILSEFNIPATFFINGEFIRRYPNETKQIVANKIECASMFYSSSSLLKNNFVIDSEFIKRGLARNEDEFFALTGKELSLMWHAPYFDCNQMMINSSKEAGYKYVDVWHKATDRVSFESSLISNEEYLSSKELIDRIVDNIYDGMIICVDIGSISGSRNDYLYESLDLLIGAILDSEAEIVSVRDLLD